MIKYVIKYWFMNFIYTKQPREKKVIKRSIIVKLDKAKEKLDHLDLTRYGVARVPYKTFKQCLPEGLLGEGAAGARPPSLAVLAALAAMLVFFAQRW